MTKTFYRLMVGVVAWVTLLGIALGASKFDPFLGKLREDDATDVSDLSNTIVSVLNTQAIQQGAIDGLTTTSETHSTDIAGLDVGALGVSDRVDNAEAALLIESGRVDSAEVGLAALTTSVANADGGVLAVSTRVDTAETDIGSLDGGVLIVSTRVDNAETDISNLDDGVVAVSSRVDQAVIDITGLDAGVLAASGRVDTVEGDITDLDTGLLAASGRVDTVETIIPELDSGILAASGRVDSAETGLSTLTTRVDNVETDVAGLEGSNVVYFGILGSDANDGMSRGTPMRSPTGAMAAALSYGPTPTEPWVIECLDAARYTNDLIGQADINVHMPMATLIGNHSISNGNFWYIYRMEASSGNMLSFSGAAGAAAVRVLYTVLSGTANGFLSFNGNLAVDFGAIQCENNYAIGGVGATMDGEIHAFGNQIIVTGTGGGIGMIIGAAGEAFVNITEIHLTTNGTGLRCAAGAEICGMVGEIHGAAANSIAWNNDGTMNIICGEVEGIKTEGVKVYAVDPSNTSKVYAVEVDGLLTVGDTNIIAAIDAVVGNVNTSGAVVGVPIIWNGIEPSNAWPRAVGFKARSASAQDDVVDATYTTIAFELEDFDTHSLYATNTYICTPGTYTGLWFFVHANYVEELDLDKNARTVITHITPGATNYHEVAVKSYNGNGGYYIPTCSTVINVLTATDQVMAQGYHNNGDNTPDYRPDLTARAWFAGTFLGRAN